MYGYSRDSIVKNLEDLCSVPGVSGCEKQTGISDAIYTLAKHINPDTIQDQRGNVISILGTGDTKIALDAHMDEVGFTIVDISTQQIELALIGVYTLSQIAGSPVWIVGKDIFWTLYVQDERLFFRPDHLEETDLCSVGDILTFQRSFRHTSEEEIEATALDNRVGCSILLEILKTITVPEDLTLVCIFSVQEEINNSNIDEISRQHGVHHGIIIESAYAQPLHFDTSGMVIPRLWQGCAIQYQWEDFVIDQNLIWSIETLAHNESICIQQEIPATDIGRTNCSKFQRVSGLECCAINIPVRNQHIKKSQVCISDMIEAYKLIVSLIAQYRSIFK